MDNTKIKKVLEEFVEKSDYNAILIDGPWGCGKTHQINEFIKAQSSGDSIYYISLFGLESIDEINTNLYYQTNRSDVAVGKIKELFKQGLNLVSKVIPVIDPISKITDALDNQLGNSKKNVKNNCVIVFDDLERLSKNVEYTNMLGYINSLFLSGCRIICLASSTNMDAERVKDYDNFKEKIFDCIYSINEVNIDLMDNIFSKFNIVNVSSKYYLFDNNLRMAKKVSLFYEKILELYKKRNNDIKKNEVFNELIIFEAAIYTVIISLKNNHSKICNNSAFEHDKKIFGENIAYGLQLYFYQESLEYRKRNVLTLVEKMLCYFCFMETEELESTLFPMRIENEYEILNEEFFYLSPKKKSEYKEVLERYLLKNDFDLKDNINKISNVIRYSNLVFSQQVISKIAEKYVKTYKSNGSFILFDFHIDETSGASKERALDFKEKLIEEIKITMNKEISKYALMLNDEKDYNELGKIIDEIIQKSESLNMSDINKVLIDNDFYLPDLSGEIDDAKWNYSHKIAKYASMFKLEEEFKNYLIKIHFESPENETLEDRLISLIIYNIDKSFKFSNIPK